MSHGPAIMAAMISQFEAQRGLCWICCRRMQPHQKGKRVKRHTASIDHMMGGGCGAWLLAHRDCNSARKGNPIIDGVQYTNAQEAITAAMERISKIASGQRSISEIPGSRFFARRANSRGYP